MTLELETFKKKRAAWMRTVDAYINMQGGHGRFSGYLDVDVQRTTLQLSWMCLRAGR